MNHAGPQRCGVDWLHDEMQPNLITTQLFVGIKDDASTMPNI